MKAIKQFLALFCIILALFSMSGCRDSAVLERIIYDYLRANQTDMEKSLYDDVENQQPDDMLHDLTKDDRSQRENDLEMSDPVLDPTQNLTADASAGSEGFTNTENQPDTGDSQGLDPKEDGSQGAAASELTSRLVVDDYGNRYQVPENVNTVAAIGSAAVAVLMLGGVDCLQATDTALASAPLASAVFPGLSDVPALWETGSDTLSDDGLERLLQLHPDLCLETSGSAMLTNGQVEILQENGIGYVVLPAPSSTRNVELMVQAIGKILGDHTADGGYDSVRLAEEYCAWVDKTLTAAGGGAEVYTIYVDRWDAEAYYTIDQASGCYGRGAAVLDNGRMTRCMAVSAFLSAASVTNVTSLASFSRSETIYFTPIDGNYSTVTVTGSAAARLTPNKLLAMGNYLGSASFQVVIAGSRRVKEGLESCTLWNSFGRVTSSNGNFVDYGFLDDYGEIVRSTIAGPYTVVVNPTGVGDWAGGSVESVLETVWACYALTGRWTQEAVRDTISEFYQTFYRYTLSDTQLDEILAGET